jgi:hypothetical protein
MLISVKNDCATKAYVGPVLSYYEVVREDLHRMTDQEWEEMLFADENLSDHSLPRPDWVYEFVR